MTAGLKGNAELAVAELAGSEERVEAEIDLGGTPLQLIVSFQVPRVETGMGLPGVGQLMAAYARQAAQQTAATAIREVEKRWRSLKDLPPEPPADVWEPLRPNEKDPAKAAEFAARWGIPVEDVLAEEQWVNTRYVVSVRDVPESPGRPPMKHLSIRRFDRAAVRDWRDFQRIKNDVCGPESEGAELYPAESRLCDSANQYHLWVIPPGVRFPFGYSKREVNTHSDETGARQRDWAEGETPPDARPGSEFQHGVNGQSYA